MILATESEFCGFQSWYNVEDFDYTPYLISNGKDVATFNALERMFSENILDLPIDLITFRGVPYTKDFSDCVPSSPQTGEWVGRDPNSGYETKPEIKLDSFPSLFLHHLESGRREFEGSLNRSLLKEHEDILKQTFNVK